MVATFSITETRFRAQNLHTKFSYDQEIHIVASASRWDGIRYLAIKHKNPPNTSANFGWFRPAAFHSYVLDLTLESLKQRQDNNPYYWLDSDSVRFTKRLSTTNNENMSKIVLVKFEEDNE